MEHLPLGDVTEGMTDRGNESRRFFSSIQQQKHDDQQDGCERAYLNRDHQPNQLRF